MNGSSSTRERIFGDEEEQQQETHVPNDGPGFEMLGVEDSSDDEEYFAETSVPRVSFASSSFTSTMPRIRQNYSDVRNENDDLQRAIEQSLQNSAGVNELAAALQASLSMDSETHSSDRNDTDKESVKSDEDLLEKLKSEDELARRLFEEAKNAKQEKEMFEAQQKALALQREEEEYMLDMQLASLPPSFSDAVRLSAREIFLDMRDKHQRDGGRPADFELALSLAQDRAKDVANSSSGVEKSVTEKSVAAEMNGVAKVEGKGMDGSKGEQLDEVEEQLIKDRQQESRQARAARFAAAFDKKLQKP